MSRPYIGGSNASVVAVSADKTLTSADHGKSFFMDPNATGGIDITLPAVSNKGFEVTFYLAVVGDGATKDADIVQAAADEDFLGMIIDGAGTVDLPVSGDTKIIFDQSGGATVGDWVRLISDGTNWYVSGMCSTAGDVVFG
tara:strand:+ start:5458 stop:5880 length:423 start_codon:yes stop_codon:yes gene_type:complete